jgi:hypothetical protein
MGYLNEDGLATLVGKVKGQMVQLTSEQYRNLPSSKNTDNKIYFVEDEDYARAIDNEPTLNSGNFVKSGGVYTYTSKIGTGSLTTTAKTLIPAVNELKNSIDVLSTKTSDVIHGGPVKSISATVPAGSYVNVDDLDWKITGKSYIGSLIYSCEGAPLIIQAHYAGMSIGIRFTVYNCSPTTPFTATINYRHLYV